MVGVSSDTKDAICHRIRSLEELKEKTECELRRILLTASRVPPAIRQEDLRRLCRSLHNLRKYTDALVYGSKGCCDPVMYQYCSFKNTSKAL